MCLRLDRVTLAKPFTSGFCQLFRNKILPLNSKHPSVRTESIHCIFKNLFESFTSKMTFSKHPHLTEFSNVLFLIVAKALHGFIQMEYHASDTSRISNAAKFNACNRWAFCSTFLKSQCDHTTCEISGHYNLTTMVQFPCHYLTRFLKIEQYAITESRNLEVQ